MVKHARLTLICEARTFVSEVLDEQNMLWGTQVLAGDCSRSFIDGMLTGLFYDHSTHWPCNNKQLANQFALPRQVTASNHEQL